MGRGELERVLDVGRRSPLDRPAQLVGRDARVALRRVGVSTTATPGR